MAWNRPDRPRRTYQMTTIHFEWGQLPLMSNQLPIPNLSEEGQLTIPQGVSSG
jgi:hypothetical protein